MVATTLALISTIDSQQESYLTSTPTVNFFTSVYNQYYNFVYESIRIPLHSDAKFGNKTNVIIPNKGHLLSKLFLEIKLPQLNKIDGTFLSWCDTVGYAIFSQPIELMIGGVIVDRLYPKCMDMMNELSSESKRIGINRMILKSDMWRSTLYNATQTGILTIPLSFWFCNNYSLALPICMMTSQEIQINFSFNTFDNLINYDGILGYDRNISIPEILDSRLIIEYIFIDDKLLNIYKSNPLRFLIEQQTSNSREQFPAGTSIINTHLYFENSSKYILFALVSQENIDSNNHFNYSLPDYSNNYYTILNQSSGTVRPFITDVQLLLNGTTLYEDYLPESFFRNSTPMNVANRISDKHMYLYPFCLNSNNILQPTGSLNLTNFDSCVLSLKMSNNIPI